MDDIMIDISRMKGYAQNLDELFSRMIETAHNLLELDEQMAQVWIDTAYLDFRKDLVDCVGDLLNLAKYTKQAADVCQLACEEYEKADQMVFSGGSGGGRF